MRAFGLRLSLSLVLIAAGSVAFGASSTQNGEGANAPEKACAYHKNPANEPTWLGRRVAELARKAGYNPSRDDIKAFEADPRKLFAVRASIRAAQVMTDKVCGNDGNGAYDGTESNALFHAYMSYFLLVLQGNREARDFMLGHEMTAHIDLNTLMDLTNNSWGFHLAERHEIAHARDLLQAVLAEYKLLSRKTVTSQELAAADAKTREKASALIQDSLELLDAGVFDVVKSRGSKCERPGLYPNLKNKS